MLPARKILLIKWIEQGATVLAYDAIREAVRRLGRENVYFCVFEENREIVDLLDVIPGENVLTIRRGSPFVFLWEVVRTLRKIRRLRIDATIDMEFFARGTAIFAYLSGVAVRVGLHRFTTEGPYRGDLMTHRVQHNPHLHVAQAYRLLVDALSQRPDGAQPLGRQPVPDALAPVPQLRPRPGEVDRVRELLRKRSGKPLTGDRLVILNPNASDLLPLRKWAPQKFVELARQILAGHPEVTIVITGTRSERESAEAMLGSIGSPRALSVAGLTSLRELIALYSLAEVMVTNDSGPGHFAALTDMDSIVLFGPETPRLFGALSARSHPVWAGLGCSPCVNALNHRRSPCRDNVCMQAITVDQVYQLLTRLLFAREPQAQRGLLRRGAQGVDPPALAAADARSE